MVSTEHPISTPDGGSDRSAAGTDGVPGSGLDGGAPRTVDPARLARAVQDLLTVRRVFGEAYERDGVQVIPVAKVLGSAGSGWGSGESGGRADGKDDSKDAGYGSGDGGGGGLGVRVRPVGVYVLDDQGVHWRPALDLDRVILGGQLVGMVAVLAIARALRRRGRR